VLLWLWLGCSQNLSPSFVYFFKLGKVSHNFPLKTLPCSYFSLQGVCFVISKKQLVLRFPLKNGIRSSDVPVFPHQIGIFAGAWMALHKLEFPYLRPVLLCPTPQRSLIWYMREDLKTEWLIFVCWRKNMGCVVKVASF